MGMTSARKFRKLVENVRVILSIELVAAAQAVDLRKVKKLGKGTRELYNSVRKQISMLTKDRIISEDIKKSVEVLKNLKD